MDCYSMFRRSKTLFFAIQRRTDLVVPKFFFLALVQLRPTSKKHIERQVINSAIKFTNFNTFYWMYEICEHHICAN